MGKKGIAALLVCALAACLALAGCGSPSTSESAASSSSQAAQQTFIGTWDLTSMSKNGEVTGSSELERLKESGGEVFINLNEDGSAALQLASVVAEGTWEAQSDVKGTVTFEGQDVDMTIEGGQLAFEQSGYLMTFERGESKEVTATLSAPQHGAQSEEVNLPLADDEVSAVTLVSKDVDATLGMAGLTFRVENRTDRAVFATIQPDSLTVDGVFIEAVGGQTIEPGESAEVFVGFDREQLGGNSLDDVREVAGEFAVWDDETLDDMAVYPFSL